MTTPQSSKKTKMEFYTVEMFTTDQTISMPVIIPVTLMINRSADITVEQKYITNIVRSIRLAWLKQIKYLPIPYFNSYFKIGKELVHLAELVSDTTRFCIYSKIQNNKQTILVRDNKTGIKDVIIANVNYSFRRIIEFEAIRNVKNPKKDQFAIKILNREKHMEVLRTQVCTTTEILATRAFKIMNEIVLKMTNLEFDWINKLICSDKLDIIKAYTGLYPFYILQIEFNQSKDDMNLQYFKSITDLMDIVDYNIKGIESLKAKPTTVTKLLGLNK